MAGRAGAACTSDTGDPQPTLHLPKHVTCLSSLCYVLFRAEALPRDEVFYCSNFINCIAIDKAVIRCHFYLSVSST